MSEQTFERTPDMAETAKVEPASSPAGLTLLRKAFPAHQISKLPKESKRQIEERKAGQNAISGCLVCGGWHHKNAVHLDYVGHAALTDRLLDADPFWSWEPAAFTPEGLPAFDRINGLWIRLTVCGITRLGYGCADGKQGGDAVKEIIGDALRNAAMRFGAALDLWHKGDLHVDNDDEPHGNGSTELVPTLHPEGPDFFGCPIDGVAVLNASQAKKAGLDLVHDRLRHAASELPTREAVRTFCESNQAEIATMPHAWRVELRSAVDLRAEELGIVPGGRRAS